LHLSFRKLAVIRCPDGKQSKTVKLATAFERFTRRFKVAEAATVMQNSLNALDIQALLFIDEHPKCDLGNVARHLQIVLTTMSPSADRLVRWEMIERTALGQDRTSR